MATQPLDFGARRGFWPAPHVCRACSSTRDASRGYPNDVWYCAPCAPPELRFPWEPGFVAPAAAMPPIATVVAASAADLLSGLSPA